MAKAKQDITEAASSEEGYTLPWNGWLEVVDERMAAFRPSMFIQQGKVVTVRRVANELGGTVYVNGRIKPLLKVGGGVRLAVYPY